MEARKILRRRQLRTNVMTDDSIQHKVYRSSRIIIHIAVRMVDHVGQSRFQAAGCRTATAFCFLCMSMFCIIAGIRPSSNHGSIVMGVPNNECDNATWKLWVDWDNTTTDDYRCQPNEQPISVVETESEVSCIPNEDIPNPIHTCMTHTITYTDQPPRGGPHRPLWPVYGEYLFAPPQRWVHSLEHGAIVMLYHPCADSDTVDKLRQVVTSCLRRHVITPYRQLPLSQPLALLSYGCKMTMSTVNVQAVKEFIVTNAFNSQRAIESTIWMDGQYSLGLQRKAVVPTGSNVRDAHLCPNAESGMFVQENMQDVVLPSE